MQLLLLLLLLTKQSAPFIYYATVIYASFGFSFVFSCYCRQYEILQVSRILFTRLHACQFAYVSYLILAPEAHNLAFRVLFINRRIQIKFYLLLLFIIFRRFIHRFLINETSLFICLICLRDHQQQQFCLLFLAGFRISLKRARTKYTSHSARSTPLLRIKSNCNQLRLAGSSRS